MILTSLLVGEVEGIPDDLSCGQQKFSKDGKTLFFAAASVETTSFFADSSKLYHSKRRLGRIYCGNRDSHIWAVPLEATYTALEAKKIKPSDESDKKKKDPLPKTAVRLTGYFFHFLITMLTSITVPTIEIIPISSAKTLKILRVVQFV